MASTNISVVRLAPTDDNVSAGMLRNAILDYFWKQQGPDAVPSNDRFTVVNKYFEAHIRLLNMSENTSYDGNNDSVNNKSNRPATDPSSHLISANAHDNSHNASLATDATTTTTFKEDGIILVFDAMKSNPDMPLDGSTTSFGALGPIHEKAVEEGAGDLLRLCVGVTIGTMEAVELRGRAYEEEYARRVGWCLDRGYEYVECDLSPEAIVKGHDDRDKEGFARIIEALQGTMWSTAQMKATAKSLKQAYQEDKEQLEQVNSEYVPPDPSLLQPNDDHAREEEARQAIMAQSGISEEGGQAVTETGQEENLDPHDENQQQERDRAQERIFDNLESALQQAASIREMSRASELSDDDRRKRAGDAADLLMTLMMQVGLDDESSAGDDEENENDRLEQPL